MKFHPSHAAAAWLLAALVAATAPARAADIYWQGVERGARALLPDQPDGAKPFLDALENRAEERLARLEHPTDRDAWKRAAPDLRKRLTTALGIDRLPKPQARNVRQVGTVDRGDYVIEKIVYETLPDCPVAAHVYRPKKVEGKLPAVLYPPGHSWAEGKSHPDGQALGASLARDGFVMLTYDPHGEGERGVSFRDHRRTELLLVGVCQEAVPVFESRCALEYLLARPDVDPERVGITGESGGGYNTWMMMALEPRLAAGVPVVGTSEFYEQLHVVRGLDWYMAREHCHFVPGLLTFANNHEYVALAAPRPLLVVAADKDDSFRLPGIRKVVGYGRGLYKALGAPERLGYFEDLKTPHGYQKPKREAAHGWFRRWLQGKGSGEPVPEGEVKVVPADAEELRCFPAGKNQPAGPGIVAQVHRLFDALPRPAEAPAADELRKSLAEALGVPLLAGDGKLTRGAQRREGGVLTERLHWPAPDGVTVPALLIAPPEPLRGVVMAAADGGKEELLRNSVVRSAVESGLAVVAVDVRGTGELAPNKPGWVFAVSLLLGENFAGRQALDLASGRRAVGDHPLLRGRPVGPARLRPRRGPGGALRGRARPGVRVARRRGRFRELPQFRGAAGGAARLVPAGPLDRRGLGHD